MRAYHGRGEWMVVYTCHICKSWFRIQMLTGPKTVADACCLCIIWSKNTDRCLIPFVSVGPKTVTDAWYLLYQLVQKQWQMLDTFCISRSKNSDRCLRLLYQLAQRKGNRCFLISESAIPKSKSKFLVDLSYFYTKIHLWSSALQCVKFCNSCICPLVIIYIADCLLHYFIERVFCRASCALYNKL